MKSWLIGDARGGDVSASRWRHCLAAGIAVAAGLAARDIFTTIYQPAPSHDANPRARREAGPAIGGQQRSARGGGGVVARQMIDGALI